MFSRHMASMTGGWGGSFDKLDEWLADEGADPRCGVRAQVDGAGYGAPPRSPST